jgi:tryptophan-rich sensory protein
MLKLVKLVGLILTCQLAGIIGSIFTASAIETWYSQLVRPSFAPPNWLFGPVWVSLYTLMGISLYLIWNQAERGLLIFFFVHLLLNSLWSILFFGLQNPLISFIEIVVLWLMIIVIVVRFYRLKPAAGLLQIPYLLWVGFAMVLNFSFWWLNR